jgi:hypothetical protein
LISPLEIQMHHGARRLGEQLLEAFVAIESVPPGGRHRRVRQGGEPSGRAGGGQRPRDAAEHRQGVVHRQVLLGEHRPRPQPLQQ